ncbi:MAG: response regulator, partial [Ferruginibacter sp.]
MSTNRKISIFLVDDDAMYLKLLDSELSENPEYVIRTFSTGERCLDNLSEKPDVIVLDYYLNGIEKYALNGLETLNRIKSAYPEIPVIMLSSQDKIEVAVNCMKLQAFEY